MKSLQGHLLIASRSLLDPNFARAVVLLVQHNEEGAFGLILNRPTNLSVRKVWEQASEITCMREEPLHLGGPVDGPLMAVHMQTELSEIQIVPGVHFSVRPEHLEQIVAHEGEPARFFAGFAGWGPGQLEHELREDSWLTLQANEKHIFEGGSELWDRIIRQALGSSLISDLKIKHVPEDPSMN